MRPRILVIGKNPAMMEHALSLLAEAGYDPTGTLAHDEARTRMEDTGWDAVVVGGGVDDDEREEIHTLATLHGITVIDAHPATLLTALAEAIRAR